jgi:hypothetical protein
LALAREVRYATEELTLSHNELALALDASTDDLGRSLEGRSVTAAVYIRALRGATIRYARRLELAIDHYETLNEDQD